MYKEMLIKCRRGGGDEHCIAQHRSRSGFRPSLISSASTTERATNAGILRAKRTLQPGLFTSGVQRLLNGKYHCIISNIETTHPSFPQEFLPVIQRAYKFSAPQRYNYLNSIPRLQRRHTNEKIQQPSISEELGSCCETIHLTYKR